MGFTKTHAAAALALIAMLAIPKHVEAGTSAWHFDVQSTLLLARLDPIVSENKVASHVHRIWGGNNFAAGYSYEDSQKGNCSSIYVQEDKSNYWVPQLYVTEKDAKSATNTYTVVSSDHRFYYFLDRSFEDVPVAPFPEGLRMLVGNLSAKSYAETGLPEKALTFVCQDPDRPDLNVLADNFNFPKACVELKTELKFPSCWDGKNLWTENGDMSHMAYPEKTLYGPCPFSHPIRLPAIMLENTWKIQKTKMSGSVFNGRFIWAHGDTTGYGFHADFTSGWNTAFLKNALEDPACLLGKSIPAVQCPSLAIDVEADVAKARACKPMHGYVNETGTTDNESVGRLPGCNLPWSSGAKPECTETPALPNINNFLGVVPGPNVVPADRTVAPNTRPVNTWEKIGCMDAYVLDLGNKTMWHDWHQMTNDNCHDFCADIGYPYAATTLGYQCMCGKNMNTASYNMDDSKCSKPCTGIDSTNCGADGAYNTYYNSAVALAGPKQPSDSDKSYLGCHVSGTIKGHLSSKPEDVDTCRTFCKGYKYFGLTNAKYCNCANEFSYPESLESRVADFSCQAKCTANSAQICGGNVDGTFYDSVYLVDGTFDAAGAVGTATTVSSEVPTGTATGDESYTAVAGQAGQNHVVITSAALFVSTSSDAASSATVPGKTEATPLPAVNKLAAGDGPASDAVESTSSAITSASSSGTASPSSTQSANDIEDQVDSQVLASTSSFAAATAAKSRPTRTAHHGGHVKCTIVTKTVTVTVTPKATTVIQQRHAARRSRHHALTFP